MYETGKLHLIDEHYLYHFVLNGKKESNELG